MSRGTSRERAPRCFCVSCNGRTVSYGRRCLVADLRRFERDGVISEAQRVEGVRKFDETHKGGAAHVGGRGGSR